MRITIGRLFVKIFWVSFVIINALAWFTGWECGFFGSCDNESTEYWQGAARVAFIIINPVVLFRLALHLNEKGWFDKEIHIPIPKAFIPFGPNHPDWEDFQQFKREYGRDIESNKSHH